MSFLKRVSEMNFFYDNFRMIILNVVSMQRNGFFTFTEKKIKTPKQMWKFGNLDFTQFENKTCVS